MTITQIHEGMYIVINHENYPRPFFLLSSSVSEEVRALAYHLAAFEGTQLTELYIEGRA